MNFKPHVVVIDDEPDLRDAVCEYLAANGCRATGLGDAAAFRAFAATEPFDIAILDINMPGEDGLSLARWLRARSRVGILFATAAGQPVDRIVGIEVGADDYVVKPFELRELLARVRSILRRTGFAASSREDGPNTPAGGKGLRIGELSLDLAARRLARADGDSVPLTASEFRLLELLAGSAGRVVSRQRIIEQASSGEPESERAIDIRVARLRRKIEPDPDNPRYIRTVRGEGYLLATDPA